MSEIVDRGISSFVLDGRIEPVIFAIIGDFANASSNELGVSNQVKSWSPQFIVTTGDNWYGPGNSGTVMLGPNSLDSLVGPYYGDFIFPYLGAYGSGSPVQRFFATVGNHDRDANAGNPTGRLPVTQQYFNLAKTYYDFAIGPVHFFIVDSGYDNSQVNRQSDGVDVNSVQATWLRTRLAASTASFKLVLMHHPPYSSTISAITTPPLSSDGMIYYPALQWPYKTWGADAVIFGHVHNYERLLANSGPSSGTLFIANGAGGQPGTTPEEPALFHNPPLAISQLRYGSDFGAQRVTVTAQSLKMEFITQTGSLIDTVLINR